MLGRFFYLRIIKSMACDQSVKKMVGFLDLHTDIHVTFYVFICFQIAALILSLKRRFRISSHAMISQ